MDVTKRPIGQETHGATSMGTRHNAHRPKTVLSTLKPGLGRDVCTILVRANRRGNILKRSIMDVTKRPIGQETHGATSMGTRHNAHRPKIALSPMKPGCGRHVWHLRQSLLLPWNVPDARKEVHPPQDRTILPHGRWSNHFQNVYPKSSCSCGLISLFVATYIDTLSFLCLFSFFPLSFLSISSLFPLSFLSLSSLFPLSLLSFSSLFPLSTLAKTQHLSFGSILSQQ